MQIMMRLSLSALIGFEGGATALDKFLEFGAIVWRSRFNSQQLPGIERTFVPLTETGGEIIFRDEITMLKTWGDSGEPSGRGSQLLRGERLSLGEEYPIDKRSCSFATWSGMFLLRWGNENGNMEVFVNVVADEVVVCYDGQRGTLVGYEFAEGSPVIVPLSGILSRLLDEGKASLVSYETSEASRHWSPFSIEADHRSLWKLAYGGMPRRLWKEARPLVEEEYQGDPDSLNEDGDALAFRMKPYFLEGGVWKQAFEWTPPKSLVGDVRWAFSEGSIARGYYLAVDIETNAFRLGPMEG